LRHPVAQGADVAGGDPGAVGKESREQRESDPEEDPHEDRPAPRIPGHPEGGAQDPEEQEEDKDSNHLPGDPAERAAFEDRHGDEDAVEEELRNRVQPDQSGRGEHPQAQTPDDDHQIEGRLLLQAGASPFRQPPPQDPYPG
jgi:hypothetical protein